jgi:putative spermidine/putrescine transport system ATP-binding protein
MAMVQLDKLSKNYGDVVALAEVDLEVEEGEFMTLLGPSGSGKTTMLNLIAGMIAPTAGRVFIDGRDVSTVPPNKRGLGMVFQNYALMPHMTIFENIAFPLRVRKTANDVVKREVGRVLDLIQLPHVADRKPRELSGGQQQRIALARAIVYNPSIILMDEPLGALDKKLREQMQLELKRIHTELGITMLYVTHDQEEALTMSDRIILLNEGQIEQMGEPDHLYFNPNGLFSADFLGDSNMLDATVESGGETTAVKTAEGLSLLAKASAISAPGRSVKVMVRPENVSIRRGEETFDNAIQGRIIDSIILGGVVKHYVDIGRGTAEDQAMVAEELNRPGRTSIRPGVEVTLAWNASDMHVLPLEGRLPDA